jgi:protein-S-isoprenylcysteine O-methyltransferase Ste14
MHFPIGTGFSVAWGAMATIWLAGAPFTKAKLRTVPGTDRLRQFLILSTGFALIGYGWKHLGVMSAPMWPESDGMQLLGLTVTCTGILYAIWARLTLGSNWSGRPMVKQGHELVTRGPYALTRHPIYTGLLLATVGTAIAVDQVRVLPGLALVAIGLAIKIGQEERLMISAFPNAYPIYRTRVKALFPGIW